MIRSFAKEFKFLARSSYYSTAADTTATTSMTKKLEGKVAVITGGASGLGKATAREFIRHGARVVIADFDAQQGLQTVAELGPMTQFVACDVTVEEQVAGAVDLTVARYGKMDILLNNAGIVGPIFPPSITDIDLEELDRVMRVNVRGVVAGIKHAARVMIKAGSGSILCTCSVAGVMPGLASHLYTISKYPVPGIVRSAASELCKHGVRINCITPTAVPTPLTFQQFAQVYPNASREQIEEIVYGLGPLKGAKCEEIDIAKAALYLGSDDAKYVNGQNLVIDGGLTCFKAPDFPAPPPPHP